MSLLQIIVLWVPNDPGSLGSSLQSEDHVVFISVHSAQSMLPNAAPDPQQWI